MDEWLDGWWEMDGGYMMDRWMHGWVGGWLAGWLDGWMDR
jgi:hypothetical protein